MRYKPEGQGVGLFVYFIVVLLSFAVWVFLRYYRPIMIDAACSEAALQSSSRYLKTNILIDPITSYENLKSECVSDM